MLVLVAVVAVSSVLASVGDGSDDDIPSVSLDVLVLLAFVIAFASVPSRTISKGRERGKKNSGGVSHCESVCVQWYWYWHWHWQRRLGLQLQRGYT